MYLRGLPPQTNIKFTKDGFTKWAESELPARFGQQPKFAAEPTSEKSGSGITVKQVKDAAAYTHETLKKYGPVIKAGLRYSENDKAVAVANGLEMLGYGKKARKLPKLAKAGGSLRTAAISAGVGAVAGLAAGVVAGVKGHKKVQKVKKQVAQDYVAQHSVGRGGSLASLAAAGLAGVATGLAAGVYAGVKGNQAVEKVKKQVATDYIAEHSVRGKGKPSARNDLVKKIMAEKGLKMIAASSYIKTHGLTW